MDQELLQRLRDGAQAAFDGMPVEFACLFGSSVTGGRHRLSDVDVAVYVHPMTSSDRYLELSLDLAQRLADASAVGGIEVLILNDAPLPLRGRAIRDGVSVFSRNEPLRVRYQGRTLNEFFDFEIFARRLDRELLAAIAEGRR